MTRNTFFAAVMMSLMAMFATNANAQGRMGHPGGNNGREMHMSNRGGMEMRGGRDMGPGREMNMGNRGGMEMRGGRDMGPGREMNMGNRGGMDMRGGRDMGPGREMGRGHADYRWNHDGYLYGWEGRVRHFDDGRWGYYRDGAWLYYDTFFEPDYYFAHPVAHFHTHHLNRTERAIAGAVVGTAVVAALIDALVH